jgi:hypothetical protein
MRASAIALLLASIGSMPHAAAQTSPAEPACMECHKPSETTIDPVAFAKSVHGGLDCSACHTDGVSKFPHASNPAAMPDCSGCHSGSPSPGIDFDKIAAGVKASVHVKLVDPAFRCENCHSPHTFIPASQMTNAAAAILVFNQSCLNCHAAGDTAAAQKLAFSALAEKHRLFPHWELHIQANACVECHTPRGQQGLHLILPKSQALRNCATCHAKNSLLVTKLYTHLALKERAENGWLNAVLFNNAYLTGATRNRWLDWGTFAMAGLTLLLVGAHGAGRWLFAYFRSRS